MKLLSEYMGNGVKAEVYYRYEIGDYVTVCYDEHGMECLGHPFPTEDKAEDYAEDWVN